MQPDTTLASLVASIRNSFSMRSTNLDDLELRPDYSYGSGTVLKCEDDLQAVLRREHWLIQSGNFTLLVKGEIIPKAVVQVRYGSHPMYKIVTTPSSG
ncbi:hypothetical protein JCM8547_001968 [Rhodosporidiobolus lusitaniae]